MMSCRTRFVLLIVVCLGGWPKNFWFSSGWNPEKKETPKFMVKRWYQSKIFLCNNVHEHVLIVGVIRYWETLPMYFILQVIWCALAVWRLTGKEYYACTLASVAHKMVNQVCALDFLIDDSRASFFGWSFFFYQSISGTIIYAVKKAMNWLSCIF